MFRPMTNSMEERLELIKNSMSKEIANKELQKCENLLDFYWYAQKVTEGVLAQMQVYILENYKNVSLQEWNAHNFSIIPHTGKGGKRHFGKVDKYELMSNDVLDKMFRERYDESEKITSIEFILDKHDGDFSVTFNGGPWSFLWGQEILNYYHAVRIARKNIKNENK